MEKDNRVIGLGWKKENGISVVMTKEVKEGTRCFLSGAKGKNSEKSPDFYLQLFKENNINGGGNSSPVAPLNEVIKK